MMAILERQEIERLAASLADNMKGVRPARVRLRMIEPPPRTMFDSITRSACLARIRFLSRRYQLGWLIEQETFDTPGIECATDERLADVLKKMEHARECITQGIPLEDAGIIRDTSGHLERFAHGGSTWP
jgi:hypothetical protein